MASGAILVPNIFQIDLWLQESGGFPGSNGHAVLTFGVFQGTGVLIFQMLTNFKTMPREFFSWFGREGFLKMTVGHREFSSENLAT